MLKSWLGFFVIYLLVAGIPALILAVRRFGWDWKLFAISMLVSWTGSG